HTSGHLYLSLKDANAVLDAVCWRGTAARLGLKPEDGMEVICAGRITTYPGRSKYQLVIESMELAGEGALLKLLEERKRKLAIEGFNRLEPGGPIPRPDLLIVARGGGSLEDLWAFNEEIVVRAAAASAIPLISAVGHETDTTLIDLAADLR